jgi:two-component system response regulator AtoC
MGAVDQKCRVLVWAPEPGWTRALCWILNEAGLEATSAASEAQAVALVSQSRFDSAVVDLGELPSDGAGAVQGLRSACSRLPIIVVSGGHDHSREQGLHPGQAYRHLHRPDELECLAPSVRQAAALHGIVPRDGNGTMRGAAQTPLDTAEDLASGVLVGRTASIRHARRLIAQVAPFDMTVLIRGESGTGKDVMARLIHQLSNRSHTGDFVKINCPAIPEPLLESELFGYERGAFTGAVSQKPGRFELAEGGTIFLDEIGLLSIGMQGKLLDVIEHKQFVRVGGKETIHVDARIIAATNAPVEEMIAAGSFRADLFYRLRQFTISLPPLRERIEDIPLLCEHFLHLCGAKEGFQHTELPAEVLSLLLHYTWPGNVRELEALIARYALCGDQEALEQSLTPVASRTAVRDDKLEAAELAAIMTALTECRWNRRRAAATLGISYSALRRRMAKHQIDRSPAPRGYQRMGSV